jgi:hypothetical protein
MSSIAAGTTSGSALVSTGDTTGALQLQVNGTTPSVSLAANGSIGVGSTPAYGTSGQVLTSSGTGSAPTWTTPLTVGATAQYSIVAADVQNNYVNAFNISDIATGNFKRAPLGAYQGNTAQSFGAPQWSSYYQCWYVLMNGPSDGTGLFFSKDGLSWNCIIPYLNFVTGTLAINATSTSSYQSNFTIDDSNGRMWAQYVSSGILKAVYSNITAGATLNSGWTTIDIFTSVSTIATSLRYCKMATTGASGIVSLATAGTNTRVHTITAGGTTVTSRLNITTSPSNPGGSIRYEENGKIFIPQSSGGKILYTTSGNITTGWTEGSAVSPEPSINATHCVGNGYYVYVSSNELYYSTTGTGASWTSAGISAPENLRNVFYTGTNFIATTVTTSNVYTYMSAGNTPTSFTLLGTSTAPQKTMSITTPMGQRVTAT